MKEIKKKLDEIFNFKLIDSWYKMKPNNFILWRRDLFEVDLDIFHEIDFIIGNRKN